MVEETTNQLQTNVDRLKTLGLASGIHNLVPPAIHDTNEGREVAIVNALKAEQHVIKAILTLRGYMIDPLLNKWVQYRQPIMNELGIGNFISVIQAISETFEYGNLKEEDLPRRAKYFYNKNIAFFFIYHQEFDLAKKDFNIVDTLLASFVVSAFDKEKNAGHRGTITKTYSEDLLGRIATASNSSPAQGNGFLNKLAAMNPLGKRRN